MNFGDAGLKQAFKRMYAQLRPGGVLILEPQGWSSYNKKKNLTERIYKNYQSIEFRPHNFTQYLLSSEVGFSKCEVLSIPPHPSKGFQRPIHLFTKAGPSPETSDDTVVSAPKRQERRDEVRRKLEQKEYEQKLFKKEEVKEGNMSEISQQSNESMSQYDQLENVYAPSTTPCYDTPGYNSDNQPPDASKMCYVDVNMENDKVERESQQESSSITSANTLENVQQRIETVTENQTLRKRSIEADNDNMVDAKRSKKESETIRLTINENERTTKVKEEKRSHKLVSVNENKLEEEQRRDNKSRDNYLNNQLNKGNDSRKDKEDSNTEEWNEMEDHSRTPCEKKQTERQRCEQTSDNT